MDPLIANAASGMRSRIETLDVLANNIANAGTTGYKADEEAYNLYFSSGAWAGYDEGRPPGSEMPTVERNWTDFSQGTIVPTGNSADLALASPGFFTVDGGSGLMYTRNGHTSLLNFTSGCNIEGALRIEHYWTFVGPQNCISICSLQPAGFCNVKVTVAQLAIADSNNLEVIEKRGSGYFRFSPDTKLQPSTLPNILQGNIEASNVAPAYTAVKLVGVMRSFEMLQAQSRWARK
jgi:flagellar basal body rod protein FlgG